ncbi:MAG: cupredoxin family copper-binding protein [Candidatus Absconditabacterales bacterium]
MKKTTLFLGVISLLVIAGCGQSTTPIVQTSTTPTTTTTTTQQTPTPTTTTTTTPKSAPTPTTNVITSKSISIANFQFSPASTEISVGGTIHRTNNDSVPHLVVADDGSFQSATLQPGDSFSHTFAQAGTFTYHCSIHPSMQGTVTVK